jgi:hypothetical protein
MVTRRLEAVREHVKVVLEKRSKFFPGRLAERMPLIGMPPLPGAGRLADAPRAIFMLWGEMVAPCE